MDYSDSDSDDSDLANIAPRPPQLQQHQSTGYNSYGRPSMGMMSTNNTSFEQQQDGSAASSSEVDSIDSDDDDSSAAAAEVVPRGKTFRPPRGEGDSLSSDDEQQQQQQPKVVSSAMTANGAVVATTSTSTTTQKSVPPVLHNPNANPSRGKELRLTTQNGDDSSDNDDDTPLVNMKTQQKRKAPPNNGNDSDSDSDSSAVVATIVEPGMDGGGDAMAVAANLPNINTNSTKKLKANDGTAVVKQEKKKRGPAKGTWQTVNKDGTLRKKPGPKKGHLVSKSKSSSSSSPSSKLPPVLHHPEVSSDNVKAAQAARSKLQNKVSTLPHRVSSTHIVRSFGRIKPEYDVHVTESTLDGTLYSNPHAIYPVGFSCDRFEFSPVHGRIIKLRCDILDGDEIRERRAAQSKTGKKSSLENLEPKLVDENNLGSGPIFRITWGEGVEEDKVNEPSCPFDPFVAAAHLSGDVDAIAVPLSSKKGKSSGLPEVGMRVSVKFDKCKMYGGTITKVKKQSKNQDALCNITIKYDDGVIEVAPYPDPDIVVSGLAGLPPVETEDGYVTEMNGKPVRSVLAKSPVEAWGKTLLSLGLIDEIMYTSALQTLSVAREEGFNEVKSKMEAANAKVEAANKKRRDERAAKNKVPAKVHGTRGASSSPVKRGTSSSPPILHDPGSSSKPDSATEPPILHDPLSDSLETGDVDNKSQEDKSKEESNGVVAMDTDKKIESVKDDAEKKMDVEKEKKEDSEKEADKKLDDDTDKKEVKDGDEVKKDDADKKEVVKEERSEEEIELRKKLAEMQNKLKAAQKRSKDASVGLANARIATISPFAANPFLAKDDSSKLETMWMSSAVKNEKAKMGNQGNKRKIVTPATMMDKSDTFFLPKMERLIEGLPGTEFAPSYVFHTNRSSSSQGKQELILEAKIRLQKQQKKKREKAIRAAKLSEAKSKLEHEKGIKRKLNEQLATDRRREKEEEDTKKKQERVERRMGLLNNQMDDRLFKEACSMRERNVMNFVRGLTKEFQRRRKAAEQVVGNKIDRTMQAPRSDNSTSTILVPFDAKLPPLSRTYEPEVIRVWDFLHSFSEVISPSSESTAASMQKLTKEQEALAITGHPTLGQKDEHLPSEPAGELFPDGWVYRRIKRTGGQRKDMYDRNYYSPKLSLRFRQRADALRYIEKLEEADGDEALAILRYYRREALSSTLPSLDSIQDAFDCLSTDKSDSPKRSNAIKLFERIAIDLCKVISPDLTKILSSDRNQAAMEVIGKNGTKDGPQRDEDVSCLPVTEWTWKEIARTAIIYDVLTDLGYSKVDAANLAKGHRNTGHPNSKEAKRWKKMEESTLAMMYGRIKNPEHDTNQLRNRAVRAIMSTPCTPSSVPSDWRFFLHNIKSKSTSSMEFIKDNVTKALSALKKMSSEVKESESYIANLEKCLTIIDRSSNGSSTPELHKAKQLAIRVLDSTKEKCPSLSLEDSQTNQTDYTQEPRRQKMGFQKIYEMSKEQFKAMDQSKEEYMAAALKLKEDLLKDDANDDDDDDDDDEDGEGNAQDEKKLSESELKEGEAPPPSSATENSGQPKEDESAVKKSPETATLPDKSMSDDKPGETEKEEEEKKEEPEVADAEPSSKPESLVVDIEMEDAEEIQDSAKGDEAPEKRGPGRPKKVQPKLTKEQEAIVITGHLTVGETDGHLPVEPAGKGFPDGWVFRRIKRTSGSRKDVCDRNYYSPKMSLRFKQRSDAMRFIDKLEEADGDEALAILKYHRKEGVSIDTINKAALAKAAMTTIAPSPKVAVVEEVQKEYDFTEDVPLAPELIRRCLSVLRALCASSSSEQFIYPVDPQLYPGYYETVMKPISLYDIGKFLQEAGNKFASNHDDPEIEVVVAEMGRNVRTIVHNSNCVNSSNLIVNSAEEMCRIFERLFFDWVLAPSTDRPKLEHLDDDRCIFSHESDVTSMVLICDACEAKYNMNRLKPAVHRVPKGDWYCPRCVASRSWLTADPRLGRTVKNESFSGTVQSCKFLFTEDGKPSIIYCIKSTSSGRIEFWGIEDVDKSIVGDKVEPLRCLQALSESPGYSFGRDSGIVGGAIPGCINPYVGDKAAQAALSSGTFQETVASCVALTNSSEDFTAEEWTKLLMLLVAKCTQGEALQELASKLEAKENTNLSTKMMTFWRNRGAANIIQNDVHDDDTIASDEEKSKPVNFDDIPSVIMPVIEGKMKKMADKDKPPSKKEEEKEEPPVDDIEMKSSTEEEPVVAKKKGGPTVVHRPNDMDISSVDDEASNSNNAKGKKSSKKEKEDIVMTEEEKARRERESIFSKKIKREKKREEALMGYCVGNRLKSTGASFDEDFLSTVIKATLSSQGKGLDLPAVRCRGVCQYCKLTDVALGAPLIRAPNEQEWRETFPHAVHGRTTYMIAEIPDNSPPDSYAPPPEEEEEKKTKHVTVRVRAGGELVTSRNKHMDASKNFDELACQFLPQNPTGFQSELKFRSDKDLSIITGSVAAHEVCAMAAHKSRKEKLLSERHTLYRANKTREAALACGKSIPIGNDPFGRSYWVFSAEPSSLFICSSTPSSDAESPAVSTKQWYRFHKPEEIASVITCLGNNPLSESLNEIFPEAKKIIQDRTWSTLLFENILQKSEDVEPSPKRQRKDKEEQDYGAPFVEDEDVLVESEKGKFLWDAVVVDVSKDPDTERVNGYLVHYKNWSSRFDQWVTPDRVVEPNSTNTEVQGEVLQDFDDANNASPPTVLGSMFAYQYLHAKKRARSPQATKVDVFESAVTRPSASQDEKLLGQLKGAILLIEAALPRGSVGSKTPNGLWDAEGAAQWRNFVKDAQGPESLMKCVLLLEDAISNDWFHSQATQLYASIPKQWRAMSEASLSSIALRVSILDRCLKYQFRKKSKR